MAKQLGEVELLELEDNIDEVDAQLSCLCHDCRESRRYSEENSSTSECRSMLFDGSFSEAIQSQIDLLALTQ